MLGQASVAFVYSDWEGGHEGVAVTCASQAITLTVGWRIDGRSIAMPFGPLPQLLKLFTATLQPLQARKQLELS
jgi:hypothetical protein